MKRPLAAGAAASAAALAGVALLTCADCSHPEPALDAGGDGETGKRDALADAGGGCDASWWDGGIVSDWPGWRRLTEFSPCCPVDVPLDAAASLPALNWIPCSNGASSCVELKRDWPVDNPPGYFGSPEVSRKSDGSPALLALAFGISGLVSQFGIYDVNTSKVLGGTRILAGAGCSFGPRVAGTSVALIGYESGGGGWSGAHGPPAQTLAAPSPRPLALANPLPGLQYIHASATRLSFDVQPYGWIEQWPFDSGTVVQSTNKTGASLLLDFVERDDVYARSVYGTTGWEEEYLVKPDGTVVLFRAKPKRQIPGMTSDGTSMLWCESYGASTPSSQQPNVELWAAPYTNDPAILDSTAKKIATLPVGYDCGQTIAFQGFFALSTIPFQTAIVVRVSDGAIQQVAAGPGWGFGQLGLVTATELWSTMNNESPDGSLGFRGVAFARYTLAPWP